MACFRLSGFHIIGWTSLVSRLPRYNRSVLLQRESSGTQARSCVHLRILRNHSSRLRRVSLALHRCKHYSNSRQASCVLTAAFFTSPFSAGESLVPDALRVLAVFSNARPGMHLDRCCQIPLDVDVDDSFPFLCLACAHIVTPPVNTVPHIPASSISSGGVRSVESAHCDVETLMPLPSVNHSRA